MVYSRYWDCEESGADEKVQNIIFEICGKLEYEICKCCDSNHQDIKDGECWMKQMEARSCRASRVGLSLRIGKMVKRGFEHLMAYWNDADKYTVRDSIHYPHKSYKE